MTARDRKGARDLTDLKATVCIDVGTFDWQFDATHAAAGVGVQFGMPKPPINVNVYIYICHIILQYIQAPRQKSQRQKGLVACHRGNCGPCSNKGLSTRDRSL